MKSKIVKRVLATSVATVMAASMAGCGNDANTTDGDKVSTPASDEASTPVDDASSAVVESSAEEELGQYTVLKDENGNVYDLGGMEIIIRDWWSGEESDPANAYEEARKEYRDWIQETYNFTIKQQAISTWASVPEDYANYVTTGGDDNNYVFILRSGTELVQAMNNDLMYDLATLDCLDFSEAKWNGNAGVHAQMTKGTSVYGMAAGEHETKGGVFFNKRLLEEAGVNPQEIYDMQENMTWTWDAFVDMCERVQADVDNDGVIDRYATVNFTTMTYPLAVYSNGGDFIALGDDGKYYNDLESEETLEALNWVNSWVDKYNCPQGERNWDYFIEAFKNGEAVFLPQESYNAGQQLADMEDDFGFVCFPMGPKATDYVNIYNDNPNCIPACYDADKAWKIAFAFNLWTEPVPGYEDYSSVIASSYNSFRDTESVDLTTARLLKNGRVTYINMIPGIDIGADMGWWNFSEKTPAQVAEEVRPKWAAYLEEANK